MNLYDFVIDTTRKTPDEVFEEVTAYIDGLQS
jgi:cytidylate kinase